MSLNYFERKRKEQERREFLESAKMISFGVMVGSAVGALAGVLLAPKSGKETRDDISKQVKDTNEEIKDSINKIVEDTKDMKDSVSKEILSAVDKIKYNLDKDKNRVDITDEDKENVVEGSAEEIKEN